MELYHLGPKGIKELKPSIPRGCAWDEKKEAVVCMGDSPYKCFASTQSIPGAYKGSRSTLYRVMPGQESLIFPAKGFSDAKGEYRSYSPIKVEALHDDLHTKAVDEFYGSYYDED